MHRGRTRAHGHQSNVFSMSLRSTLQPQLRASVRKDTGYGVWGWGGGGSFSLENAPGFQCQAGRLILYHLNWRPTWDSRFFRLFQFLRMQAAMMTRKMARSATKPGKMLLLWPFSLGGKPGGHAPAGHKIWAWEMLEKTCLSGDRAPVIPGRQRVRCEDGGKPQLDPS